MSTLMKRLCILSSVLAALMIGLGLWWWGRSACEGDAPAAAAHVKSESMASGGARDGAAKAEGQSAGESRAAVSGTAGAGSPMVAFMDWLADWW